MNRLAASLGETQEEADRRSREITAFFFPELKNRNREGSQSC
jgi:hypothetical protein